MKPDKSTPARLRCRLTAAAETIVRGGHPWVFAGSIRELNRDGAAGELAVTYDRNDRFLAIGLFDPDSPLRIRVLHTGKPVQIDENWWRTRLETTLAKRADLLDENTTACRLINGESDGWPGLVLDRYGDVLVLKLYTFAWCSRLPMVVEMLRVNRSAGFRPGSVVNKAHAGSETGAPTLVLRLSRNVQSSFASAGFRDAQILSGEPINAPVIFRESGLRFEADVLAGQKTGFFLDQRENRRAVEQLARGADVLNAFSFTGGFSLYAARGGARSVASLDISPHALAGAERNFALNRDQPVISACRHEIIQANAFDWLEANAERMFDLIVLDPPSLAKKETERAGAIRAYGKLAASAMRHLHPGGALVAASCSAHVSAEEFFGAVTEAAKASSRKFAQLNTTRHAPDHPATFPEAEYLKCISLRFEG
jgi:23S rRNA (cytosine1962-C5)-methyltransferase